MTEDISKQNRITNTILRGFSLISKLVLVVYLAKFFTLEDLGTYSIIFYTINFLTYLLGFEYFNYSGRQISQAKNQRERIIHLSSHFSFILSIIWIVPFIYFIGFIDELVSEYIWYLLMLLVLEFLSNEIFRVLIFLEKQIVASMILFIRSALWVYIFIFFNYFSLVESRLTILFIFWIFSVTFSIALGIYILQSLGLQFKDINFGFSFRRISSALRFSGYFFISALSVKLIFTVDKYFLKHYETMDVVGIYSFFLSICASLTTIFEASTISLYIPKLLLNWKMDRTKFLIIKRDFRRQIVMLSISSFFLYVILIFPLLYFIGKESYLSSIGIYFVLLALFIIINIGMLAHVDLYINQKEKLIAKSSVIGLVLFLIMCFVFIPSYGVNGLCFALLIGTLTSVFIKFKYASSKKNFVRRGSN